MAQSILIEAPATSANLGCGFDVLGLCLSGSGDRITLRCRPEPGIAITAIRGAEGIPLDVERNVAGLSLQALMQAHGMATGFEICLLYTSDAADD